MENKKNYIIKITLAIILALAIISIGIFVTFKTKDRDTSNNTTNQNETDPRIEYIKEPTITEVPETSMPVIDDVPTE